jgi:hypothetical protein
MKRKERPVESSNLVITHFGIKCVSTKKETPRKWCFELDRCYLQASATIQKFVGKEAVSLNLDSTETLNYRYRV